LIRIRLRELSILPCSPGRRRIWNGERVALDEDADEEVCPLGEKPSGFFEDPGVVLDVFGVHEGPGGKPSGAGVVDDTINIKWFSRNWRFVTCNHSISMEK